MYQLPIEPCLDPPDDPEPAFYCDECNEPIYVGEDYYDVEGYRLCEYCVMDWLEKNCKMEAEMPEEDYEED